MPYPFGPDPLRPSRGRSPRKPWKPSGKYRRRSRRRLLFEPLEPRLLLSGDPMLAFVSAAMESDVVESDPLPGTEAIPEAFLYSAEAESAGRDMVLRIQEVAGVDMLQVVDADDTVVHSRALAAVTDVEIIGSGFDDALSLDDTILATDLAIHFDGGAGSDSLTGADAENLWSVTEQDTGALNGNISFDSVENLSGGAGEDTFVFDEGAGLTGKLDGGGGTNTLDYSAFRNGMNLRLSPTATEGYAHVGNIQTVLGGDGDDTVIVDGRMLAETPGGIHFDGGGGADTLQVTGDFAEGVVTLNGGGGSLELDGMMLTYQGVENLNAPSADLTVNLDSGADVTIRDATDTFSEIVDENDNVVGTFDSGDNLTLNAFDDDATDQVTLESIDPGFFGSISINLKGGDDTIALSPAVNIANLNFDGGSGSDWLDYSAYGSSVSVDLDTGIGTGLASISGTENVRGGSVDDLLKGNAAANILEGGGGVDDLEGRGGDDTYVFGPGWGVDIVRELAGEGDDTLDFTALGAAASLTTFVDGHVEDNNGANRVDVLNGSGVASDAVVENLDAHPDAEIDTQIDVDEILALADALADLAAWSDTLREISELAAALPTVGQNLDTALAAQGDAALGLGDAPVSLASALDMAEILGTLQETVANFDGTATDLAAELEALFLSTLTDLIVHEFDPGDQGDLVLGGLDLSGSSVTVTVLDGDDGFPDEVRLDLVLDARRSTEFQIDLGEDAGFLGLSFDASATLGLTAHFVADITFHVDVAGGTGVLLDINAVTVGATIDATDVDVAVAFGFLTAEVVNGSIVMNAALDLVPAVAGLDPGSDLDLGLVNITVDAETLTVSLPLVVDIEGFPQADRLNTEIVVVVDELFSGDAPQVTATNDFLNGASLFDFGNIGPSEIFGMLEGLADFLSAMTGTEILDLAIPLTQGVTLGEVLNFAEAFSEDILEPLAQRIELGFGAATVGIDGDPFVAEVATATNLESDLAFTLRFDDAGEVSGSLVAGDYVDAVGLAAALQMAINDALAASDKSAVIVAVGVDGDLLSLDVTTSGAEVGDVEFTFPSLDELGNFVPRFDSLQTLSREISSLLLGDPGIFTASYDPTNDELTFDINWTHTFTVFDTPLDFSVNLGDLGGIDTSTDLSLEVTVTLDLTFGVVLFPATELAAAPPVFQVDVPDDGQLSSAATFQVILFGDPDDPDISADGLVLDLSVSDTGDNTDISRVNPLLPADDDITDDDTALVFDVQAAVDEAIRGHEINTSASNVLHLTTGRFLLAEDPDTGNIITAAVTAQEEATVFDLAEDVFFRISVDGGVEVLGKLLETSTDGNTLAEELAADLETALESALTTAGLGADKVDVTVTVSADGKLVIALDSVDDLVRTVDIRFPVLDVTAGYTGTRISFTAQSTTILVEEPFDPADPTSDMVQVSKQLDRRLEVVISDFDDPALQEMGLLSSPVPYDGNVTSAIHITLQVNGTPLQVSVAVADYGDVDGLVGAFNTSIATALAGAVTDGDLSADVELTARRVTDTGNRIEFVGLSGVNDLTLFATDSADLTDGAVVHLGLVTRAEDGTLQVLGEESAVTERGKATEFFLDNTSLTGAVTLSTGDIEASASLGFLAIHTSDDTASTASITAAVSLQLVNPEDGADRVTLETLLSEIGEGNVLYDADAMTGIINPVISTMAHVELAVTPEIGPFTAPDAMITLDLNVEDWLNAPPDFSDPETFSIVIAGDDLYSAFTDMDFGAIIDGLLLVTDFLRALDGSGDASEGAIAAVLDTELPIVDRSIQDLLNYAEQFADLLEEVEADPAGSLQRLELLLEEQLGVDDPDLVNLSLEFDEAGTEVIALRVDLTFVAGFEDSMPFGLDLESLADFVDLDLPDGFTDLIGVTTSGDIGVGLEGTLRLSLGLDVTGDGLLPDPFLYTGAEGTSLSLTAMADATNLDFTAQIGPLGILVIDGFASLEGGVTIGLMDDGTGRHLLTDSFSTDDIEVTVTGGGSATLPIFFPNEGVPLGEVVLTLADGTEGTSSGLSDFLNGVTDSDLITLEGLDNVFALDIPSILDIIKDPAIVLDGLDTLLLTLQEALDGRILGIDIPLIGDALEPAARFVEDFRDDLLGPLSLKLRELGSPVVIIQDTLFNIFASEADGAVKLFGFGQLGLLQDLNDDGNVTADDIVLGGGFEIIDFDDDGEPIFTDEVFDFGQFDFRIGQTFTAGVPIEFDLGLPAIGLEVDVEPTLEITWELDFGFGIHEEEGFYFVTERESEGAELTLDINVFLAPGAEINGTLGFLIVTLQDHEDDPGTPGVLENTNLNLSFDIDLVDPGDGDADDGRLTFAEMVAPSTSFSDVVQASAEGKVHVGFAGNVAFGNLGLDASVLPSVNFDFLMDWTLAGGVIGDDFSVNGDGPELLEFQNIELDMGSFITEFIAPVLNDVAEILEPLDWLLHPRNGILFLRIPVISDLAGETINLKSLAEQLDTTGRITPFLDAVVDLYNLINLVTDAAADAERSGGNMVLLFGDLNLLEVGLTPEQLMDPDVKLSDGNAPTESTNPFAETSDVDDLPDGAAKSFSQSVTRGEGGFEISLLQPENIFGLLMGEPDIDLIRYNLPEFGLLFEFFSKYPVFGPLTATLRGSFEVAINLQVGYDTRGVEQFLDSSNPLDLINGFFISDVDDEGNDVAEAFIRGSIAAGAALDLAVVTAGVEGGIDARIDFNLNDPDRDGKVRLGELAENVVANATSGDPLLVALSPLSVFDISGSIDWFFRAYVEVDLFFFSFEDSMDLGSGTIYDFEVPFVRVPTLAQITMDAGEGGSFEAAEDILLLNMGPSAAARYQGNIEDSGETFVLEEVDGNIEVTAFGVTKKYDKNDFTKIVAFGGEGNDTIDASLVSSVEVEFHGGAGNDVLIAGAAGGRLFGDEGNDTLTGGAGVDVLDGGLGADVLEARGDDDELFGGAGNDTLRGEGDDDTLDGGEGDDLLEGGTGDDTYVFANGTGSDTVDDAGGDLDAWDLSAVSTDVLFTLDSAGVTATSLSNMVHEEGLTSGTQMEELRGGRGADIFDIFQTGDTNAMTLNGLGGNDTYIANFADPDAGDPPPMDVTLMDVGDIWNIDTAIAFGSEGADDMTVTDEAVTANFPTGSQTFSYNSAGPEAGIESLLVHGDPVGEDPDNPFSVGAGDVIQVESTPGPPGDTMVSVEIQGHRGNDRVIVGNDVDGVDDIKGDILTGALSIKGQEGDYDTLEVNDTANTEANLDGILTGDTVTGLGMFDLGIEYTTIEVVEVLLGSGDDLFTIEDTVTSFVPDDGPVPDPTIGFTMVDGGLGGDTIDVFRISGETLVRGGLSDGDAGDDNDDRDTINVNPGRDDFPIEQNDINALLTLDGENGSDDYFIWVSGNENSIIQVLDTGESNRGTDMLEVTGTDKDDDAGFSGDDIFLLRRNFVATVHDADDDGVLETERINYDGGINEGLLIRGGTGNDFFALDDNSVTTTIKGEGGADTFQVGQMFNSARDIDVDRDGDGTGMSDGVPDDVDADGDGFADESGISVMDVHHPFTPRFDDSFGATLTTRGYLSNGISLPATLEGNGGKNTFTVFRNVAPLILLGGNNDDTFTVRAFVVIDVSDDVMDQQITEINAQGGDDSIQYAVNAPVAIDGGAGADTVVIIGTEFGDEFVITRDGAFGAGLNVSFVNIEFLDVDAGEGNDQIFILSTDANVSTRIFGGLGSDFISIGQQPPAIVSNDLLGHSGLVQHIVSGTDPNFVGVSTEGISANILDDEEPGVRLTVDGGELFLTETGAFIGFYTVVLSRAPDENVTITVSTAIPNEDDAKLLLVSTSSDFPDSAPGEQTDTAITLTFTPDGGATPWNEAQTVWVKADADTVEEGTLFAGLSHSIVGDPQDAGYFNLPIPTLVAKIIDDDAAGVVVHETDLRTDVAEGGFGDTYEVFLTREPTHDVTVQLEFDGTQLDAPDSLTFTAADWMTSQFVTVSAVDDGTTEGPQIENISHSVTSEDESYDGLAMDIVEVGVSDDDSPGILVRETLGSTDTIEGGISTDGIPYTDSYSIMLTSAPVEGTEVIVEVLPLATETSNFTGANALVQVEVSGSTLSALNTLTFTSENWNVEQFITVTALNDDVIDGGDFKAFPILLQRVFEIRGPLEIFGGTDPEADRSLPAPIMLPDERHADDFPVDNPNFDVIEEEQVDTLSIFNTDSVADDIGLLTENTVTGLGMAESGIIYNDIEILDIFLGKGADNFTVESTHRGATSVFGGPGSDTLNVKTMAGHTTISGEDDDDTINVSTLAPGFRSDPGLNGLTDSINALLTISGDAGADTVNVDDTGEEDDNDGTLTGKTLIGLDMTQLDGQDPVDLVQTITINNATGGTFTLRVVGLPDGEDTTEALAWDASAEEVRAALQELLGQNEAVIVFGGIEVPINVDNVAVQKYDDTYHIRYEGEIRGLLGQAFGELVADETQLTGGDAFIDVALRTDGINYYGLEILNIDLGSGDDRFNVQGTTAVTNLAGHDGDDVIYVSSGANLAALDGYIPSADLADLHDLILHGPRLDPVDGEEVRPGGTLDFILGDLNIDSGAGQNTLSISDRNDLDADEDVLITEDSISGLAPGNITYAATGGDYSGQGKWTTALGDLGLFAHGINIYGGVGGNTMSVTSIDTSGALLTPFGRTLTSLFTGRGDDQVTISVADDPGRVFLVRAEEGDDVLDGSASTLSLLLFGDVGSDTVAGGSSEDLIFGDGGRIYYLKPAGADGFDLSLGGAPLDDFATFRNDDDFDTADHLRTVVDLARDGNDRLSGNGADDILLGGGNNGGGGVVIIGFPGDPPISLEGDGAGAAAGEGVPVVDELTETIHGNDGNDVILGDYGRISFTDGIALEIETTDRVDGGTDVLYGDAGEDVIAGGAGADVVDGGMDDDLLFGDNVRLDRVFVLGDATNPRFRALADETIYDDQGNVNVDLSQQFADPLRDPAWSDWVPTLLDHSFDDESAGLNNFGDDYIAGGGHDDVIFGQLGDDRIQGDGSVAGLVEADSPVGAARDGNGLLVLTPSFESAATDGDDYIEGNGGDDIIFGNLGQDDILGGSSELFSLTAPEQRPDGDDTIFGGAGTDIARNDAGDTDPDGHAEDSDVILGDNGNIYRLVDPATGAYLEFEYDQTSAFEDRGDERLVVRAPELLDYTPGGFNLDPSGAATDIGGADELHGESGDDFIYGMVGNDVLFGEGQDDDLIGGWGHDWVSGGDGRDGILGDDGRIYTSRNLETAPGNEPEPFSEPLYGVLKVDQVDQDISTPGKLQEATIHPEGELKKTVELTPFHLDPAEDPLFDPDGADDILYGGLGGDFMHGGAGDDAMSGAEALPEYYEAPWNPGDVLQFGGVRANEFAAYDEFDPWRKILVDENGMVTTDPSGVEFLLNFEATEGPVAAASPEGRTTDGDDVLFGDLGNDWLVGGTGQDHLYGGWGDDLLNADDDHDTTLGSGDDRANNDPDTDPTYEDIAFGGAGRDVLIANTGGDRLIDWTGEFNSYVVPFSPFGAFTISRSLQPQLFDYLYDLSEADGADQTRAADAGTDADRNGEPDGELGLVKQQDDAWGDQTGAPDDPQPGNDSGARDVLRAADFANGMADGFTPDSGRWVVEDGRLAVGPEALGGDAVSVFYVDELLPSYLELLGKINANKATGGYDSNAYLIFDYQSETDFKFAGINIKTNKLQMGHRTAEGWIVDVQINMQLKWGTDYQMSLALDHSTVTLTVELVSDALTTLVHKFDPRVDANGYEYGLNGGMVGVGTNNSIGRFDDIVVQVIPPELTLEHVDDFSDGVADLFVGDQTGVWAVSGDRYLGLPEGMDFAVSMMDLGLESGLAPSSTLDLETRLRTNDMGGIVFDHYSDVDFKFVALLAAQDQVIIGHYSEHDGWSFDAVADLALGMGVDHDVHISLDGTSVDVAVDGRLVLGHAYFSLVVDGGFGLFAQGDSSSFDLVEVRTDDPVFAATDSLGDGVSPELLTDGNEPDGSPDPRPVWSGDRDPRSHRIATAEDSPIRAGDLLGRSRLDLQDWVVEGEEPEEDGLEAWQSLRVETELDTTDDDWLIVDRTPER